MNTFDLRDEKQIQDLKNVVEEDSKKEPELEVVDIDENNLDLDKKDYIGKAIIECDVCHTLFYKDLKDLKKDETTEKYNLEDKCSHCGATEGYNLIGQVASLEKDEEKTPTEEPKEEPEEEKVDEEEPEEIENTEPEDEDSIPSIKVDEDLNESLEEAPNFGLKDAIEVAYTDARKGIDLAIEELESKGFDCSSYWHSVENTEEDEEISEARDNLFYELGIEDLMSEAYDLVWDNNKSLEEILVDADL